MTLKSHRYAYLLLCVFLMQACNVLQTDKDIRQRLYETDAIVMEAWRLAAELRFQGHISDESWPRLRNSLISLSEGLEDAWDRYKTSPEEVQESLGYMEPLLAEVKIWLKRAHKTSVMYMQREGEEAESNKAVEEQ